MIKKIKRFALYAMGLVMAAGLLQCTMMNKAGNWIAPEKEPKMAHVHIGHAMTHWKQTPDNMGLFVVAEKEADIAFTHANMAMQKSTDLDHIKLHVANVMHAIDPKTQKKGPGLEFGQRRALSEAISHIAFAAESDDASENVKRFVESFTNNSASILERCDLIIALGEDVQKAETSQEAVALADEIAILASANIEGIKSGGNGNEITDPNDFGLKHLRVQIEEMIDREVPPYQPVPRRYLLGVVRLPSGKWTYWWKTSNNSSEGGGGGAGY